MFESICNLWICRLEWLRLSKVSQSMELENRFLRQGFCDAFIASGLRNLIPKVMDLISNLLQGGKDCFSCQEGCNRICLPKRKNAEEASTPAYLVHLVLIHGGFSTLKLATLPQSKIKNDAYLQFTSIHLKKKKKTSFGILIVFLKIYWSRPSPLKLHIKPHSAKLSCIVPEIPSESIYNLHPLLVT